MPSSVKTQTLPWGDWFDDVLQPGWSWVNEDPNLHWFSNNTLYLKIGSNSDGFKNRLLRSAPNSQYSIICFGDPVTWSNYNGQRIRTLLYTNEENYARLEWNPSGNGGGTFYVRNNGVVKQWSVSNSVANDVGLFALGYVPELGSIHVLMGDISYGIYGDEKPIDSLFQISFVPQYVGFEAIGSSGDTIMVGNSYHGFTILEFPYVRPPKITNFSEISSNLRVDWQTDYPIQALPSGWLFKIQLTSTGIYPIVSPLLPSTSTSYVFSAPDCNGCANFEASIEHIPTYLPLPGGGFTGPWRIGDPISPPPVSYSCSINPLQADFLPHQDPSGSPVVQFENLSSGEPDFWLWNFGDGTTSSDQNPTHFFPAGCLQDFSVSLTVRSRQGCSDTKVQEVHVTPTNEFPRPKALLVSGFTSWVSWEFDPMMLSASSELESKGWNVDIMRNPTYAELSTLLSSPEYRGLYIVAHGLAENGISEIALRHEGWGVDTYSAENIGGITGGREMDFVTVISCAQYRNQWESAFNVPASKLILPYKHFGENREASLLLETLAAYLSHGVSTQACETDHELITNYPTSGLHKIGTSRPDTSCLSFLYYDDGKCGADMFPVRVCQSGIGAPYEGSIMIEAPDSTFTIRAVFPSAYKDTVALSATCFIEVPSSLRIDTVSLNRHLCFAAVTLDSAIKPDRFEIQLKYKDSELVEAGIASESQLRIGWVSSNREFAWVEADHDTLANTFNFVVTEYGVVGIYGSTTFIAPPVAPPLVSPLNGTTGVSTSPTLSWKSSTGAISYHLQVSTDSSFTALVDNQSDLVDTSQQVSSLGNDTLYYWRVNATNLGGTSDWSNTWTFSTTTPSSVQQVNSNIPTEYRLDQNYPNPFNPVTTIQFSLPKEGFVKLTIFNTLAMQIEVLVDEYLSPGNYRTQWTARDIPTGVYFCQLMSNEFISSKKLLVLR